ncbi:MAG: tol-pal system protein YbgF [Bdellovibrionota bacterium]
MKTNFYSLIACVLCAPLFYACGAKRYETSLSELQQENQQLKTKQTHLRQDIQELTDTLIIIESKLDSITTGRPVAKREFLETPLYDAPMEASARTAPIKGSFEKPAQSFLGEGIDIDPKKAEKIESSIKLTNQHLDAASPATTQAAAPKEKKSKPAAKTTAKAHTNTEAAVATQAKVEEEDQKVIDSYRKAYDLFAQHHYDEAITQLEEFTQKYPSHRYTDNAVYWVGEGYYQKNEFGKANQAFERLLKDYPDGNKVPDALLRSGICYVRMDQIAEAKKSFQKLLKDYPESMAAKKAKATLEGI